MAAPVTPENIPIDVRAIQRKAVYDFNAEHARLARQAQAGHARWLLSALVLVHFGSLLALLVLEPSGPALESGAQWLLAMGLAFALSAGLMVWVNATFSAIVHAEWADVRLLDPNDAGPVAESRPKKLVVNATNLLAVLFAALSCLAAPCAVLLLARG